ncbi:MAG TPA: DUF885 domain-containing protein [Terriglobales bacterium]|nr:DUF885 domain-containing protein [Terriglobales bacterium]
MRANPLYASFLGDKRYNDQLDDFSQKHIDEDLEQTRQFLVCFQAIDTTGFPDQEVLNKQLMVRDLKMTPEGARFKPWEMPVDQQNGVHIQLPALVNVLAFDSVKDYEDYIARLKQMPRLFGQVEIQMRKGIAENWMPPKGVLGEVVKQANELATTPADKNPFAQPFNRFPDAISEADRKRLRETGLRIIHDSILPTYAKFTTFVRNEYEPKGRPEPGVWFPPNGDEYYAFRVRESTTTDFMPEEIHQLGLAQVKAIEEKFRELFWPIGLGTDCWLRSDKRMFLPSPRRPECQRLPVISIRSDSHVSPLDRLSVLLSHRGELLVLQRYR